MKPSFSQYSKASRNETAAGAVSALTGERTIKIVEKLPCLAQQFVVVRASRLCATQDGLKANGFRHGYTTYVEVVNQRADFFHTGIVIEIETRCQYFYQSRARSNAAFTPVTRSRVVPTPQ